MCLPQHLCGFNGCVWSHICLEDMGKNILVYFPSSVQICVSLSPLDIRESPFPIEEGSACRAVEIAPKWECLGFSAVQTAREMCSRHLSPCPGANIGINSL